MFRATLRQSREFTQTLLVMLETFRRSVQKVQKVQNIRQVQKVLFLDFLLTVSEL